MKFPKIRNNYSDMNLNIWANKGTRNCTPDLTEVYNNILII